MHETTVFPPGDKAGLSKHLHSVVISISVKGALCSSAKEILIRRERSSLTD